MYAVHTFLVAGVSYDIIDLNIKIMYAVSKDGRLKIQISGRFNSCPTHKWPLKS